MLRFHVVLDDISLRFRSVCRVRFRLNLVDFNAMDFGKPYCQRCHIHLVSGRHRADRVGGHSRMQWRWRFVQLRRLLVHDSDLVVFGHVTA